MTTQLFVGGTVYSSPATPDATALAITDGMVVWVGTDDIGRALHPGAEIIDLGGRFVAPAFVDSHVHLTDTGLALGGLDLSAARSRTECLRLLAEYAAAHDDEIIWGLGWDSSSWEHSGSGDALPPTTSEIDAVVGARPTYLARIDEHSGAASSALRRLAPALPEAVGYDSEDPLIAQAHHLVRSAARTLLSAGGRQRAQLRALDHAAAHGVVAVHENGGPDITGAEDFLALADLRHGVAVRRYWGQAVTEADEARQLLSTMRADAIGGDLFIDGALGSHTAWLSSPYTDRPDESGVSYLAPDAVYAHLRATTLAGIQAGFHVIGDAATATVAAAVRELSDELGTPALSRCVHRLEHAEMVTPEQAQVLAAAGFVASMQPLFDAAWGGAGALYEQRLGDRAAALNDFAMLAKTGISLSFSSDAPVCDIDPWATIQAAVHHHQATSAISPRAAFAACTRGAWRAGGVGDGITGQLVPGAPAHFAVWDADDLVVAASHAGVQRWSTDPRSRVPALPDVTPGARLPECVRTVAAGEVIYDRDAQ